MKIFNSLSICLLLLVVACNKSKQIETDPPETYSPETYPEYFRPVTSASSKWISEIVEYRPAPGQFINTSLGDPEAARGLVGAKGELSLGGYGGYVIFKFDHTVINKQGYDFVIHGNAFSTSSEAGIVMVAADVNRNGIADPDEWYELRGSEHGKQETVSNYSVTYTKPVQTLTAMDIAWEDSDGVTGLIEANEYYDQCYYPLFPADNQTFTFSGTRLPDNGTENNGMYVLKAFGWGYADNYDSEYPNAVNDDNDTKNSNKFDIDNAITGGAKLEGIDFIKVYTAINQQNGWIGETSAEICGAISLSVK